MAKPTKFSKINFGRSRFTTSETTKKFFNLFIKPFISDFVVPTSTTDNLMHAKIELWFNKSKRDIWLVRARTPFTLVGPRWATSDTPEKLWVHGEGDRDVTAGSYLWIRSDLDRPEFLDVEFNDQVFVVESADWESVFSSKCEYVL